jgi:hypothetical protein
VVLQDVQDFMQQLLGAIADHFPQQALWAMATVCKSTVRARQVRRSRKSVMRDLHIWFAGTSFAFQCSMCCHQ